MSYKNKKYLLDSPLKTARFARILAKLMDFFLALIVGVAFYPLGFLIAVLYMGLGDALPKGQSVGKRFIGFRVISLEDGLPCTKRQSLIRNLPFIIPLCFALIPLWGWVFSLVVGIPIFCLELFFIFKLDSGHRLGDVMADTSVMGHDDNRLAMKKRKESWFDPDNAQASS